MSDYNTERSCDALGKLTPIEYLNAIMDSRKSQFKGYLKNGEVHRLLRIGKS